MLDKGRILPLKVLAKEIKPPEERGHIIIPIAVVRNPTISGEVILVGDSTKNIDQVVKVGDKILFSPNCFVRVTIDDEEFLLLNQQDVLFIWK